ncbi:hypothetical protein F1640_03275 [Novosphingobium sp. NBM11]|uniref:DUF6361 family protein n=1 Tax=Novosphingobium sp. NBM11 TaxID=2596914 RepID=UPI0018926E0B|nr:DUF6361 family protein [Novosphingobium sp. NBM11]MBF5089070.1 hypothetical protein [Novosphingobium sp. NBM11]
MRNAVGGYLNFLGWVDHDSEHEQSVLRALGAAKGHDARDELGLGTIRDSFADLFFPGLSTIQERVRYFLFVQWCCEVAARQGDPQRIIDELRRTEVLLIQRLSVLGAGEGVIGIQSQEDLERMPSEIYWNGLAVLGMRRAGGSRLRWARQIASSRERVKQAAPSEDGGGSAFDIGFDMVRPPPPAGFPSIEGLNFGLDTDEAAFLRNRLRNACVDPVGRGHEYNLFGPFSAYRRKTSASDAWDHPRVSRLRPAARDLLMLGAAFSRLMHGAVILYNIRVAELMLPEGGRLDVRDAHVASFTTWRDRLSPADVDLVIRRIGELPALGAITRHSVDPHAILFVRRWAERCLGPDTLLSDSGAAALVSDREVFLKGASGTSRIASRKARARWRGESGSTLDYRWHVARRCLNDLAAAP